MIVLNFIIGIAFGAATPWLERKLRQWAEQVYLGELPISDHEYDVLAVLAIVMIAAIVCAVFRIDSSAFLLALGIATGLFADRIWKRIRMEAGPAPEPANVPDSGAAGPASGDRR
jgi:hypothetical protein